MSGAATAAQLTSKKKVVFTFQGAFGPPTYGHYMSMKNFAIKISDDYPSAQNEVTMLFMPTGNSSDKKHLYPTQSDRKAVLDVFCEMLKVDFDNLIFETSYIEYEIVNDGVIIGSAEKKPKSNPATIVTIENLRLKYPDATILVGMGLDNMFELPFWSRIDDYAAKCEKIYVVDRELSEDDKQKVKTCIITNKSSGEAGGEAAGAVVEIQIKASIPSWWNSRDDPIVTRGMADKLGVLESVENKEQLNTAMRSADKFNYNSQLPEIVIIQPPVDMPIPGTSSTLLRKLIASFNEEADATRKGELKQMIKTMMFGPEVEDPISLTDVLDQTIRGYSRDSLNLVEEDITKILKKAEPADFDAYNILFPGGGGGGGGAGGGGGYRKKTRKNKKKSTKRILRKVKMNSRNLRMKKKRTRSRK